MGFFMSLSSLLSLELQTLQGSSVSLYRVKQALVVFCLQDTSGYISMKSRSVKQEFVFRENGDETTNKAHVEMVMREIAKFHAISYCMKVIKIDDNSKDNYILAGRV